MTLDHGRPQANVTFSRGCCIFFSYIVSNLTSFRAILPDTYVSDDDIVYFVIDY